MTPEYWLVALMISITGALIYSWIQMRSAMVDMRHDIHEIRRVQIHCEACFNQLAESLIKSNDYAIRQTTLLEQLVEEIRLLRKQNGGNK